MTHTYKGMFDEALARDAAGVAGRDSQAEAHAEAFGEMIALTTKSDVTPRAQQLEEQQERLLQMMALSTSEDVPLTAEQEETLRRMMELSEGPILPSPPKKPDDGARERVRQRGDDIDIDCHRPHATARSARYEGNER